MSVGLLWTSGRNFKSTAIIHGLAPVVQWIELEFPKLSIQVRFLSDAPNQVIAALPHY